MPNKPIFVGPVTDTDTDSINSVRDLRIIFHINFVEIVLKYLSRRRKMSWICHQNRPWSGSETEKKNFAIQSLRAVHSLHCIINKCIYRIDFAGNLSKCLPTFARKSRQKSFFFLFRRCKKKTPKNGESSNDTFVNLWLLFFHLVVFKR